LKTGAFISRAYKSFSSPPTLTWKANYNIINVLT
jgi:hypothetical protein